MAQKQFIEIRNFLNRIVPKSRLEELGRETGAFRRNRKISAPAFFWSLVMGYAVGNHRTIAGIRRSFEKSIGKSIVPSAFYDRFTPNFVNLLKEVLSELIQRLGSNLAPLQGQLSFFKDILITDSTLIRLHDLLEKTYPSVWTNYMRASMKAHVILSVRGSGMNSVKITSGNQHDGPRFRAGSWMKGKLMIFDLGYFRHELFTSIDSHGGYFLSRLKQNSNPRVVDQNTRPRRRNEPVGIRLKSYIEKRGGTEPIDVDAEFFVYAPPLNTKKGTFTHPRRRIVGRYNPDSKTYHLYVTNIPREVLNTEQVVRLYSSRWLIELLFRELKTNYRMEEIPSKKCHIAEALVYTALIGILISRAFLIELRKVTKTAATIPFERWAVVWGTIAADLLAIVLRPYRDRTTEKYLTVMIRREAFDPNRSRKLLPERAFA
jgi:IS4 transposase